MSVCQLISFLFCSRYTRDTSPVYMLVTTDTMLGLGEERFILSFLCLYFVNRDSSSVRFFNTSVYHVRDGGGECFLSSFHFMYQDYSKIFCIPMLHAAHGRLVVKLLHSDNKIMSVLHSFFQPCLCCDQ